MTDSDAEFLSPEEVAKALATSRSTVHRAIDRGDLQRLKYGRLVRIPRKSFEDFLAKYQAS